MNHLPKDRLFFRFSRIDWSGCYRKLLAASLFSSLLKGYPLINYLFHPSPTRRKVVFTNEV